MLVVSGGDWSGSNLIRVAEKGGQAIGQSKRHVFFLPTPSTVQVEQGTRNMAGIKRKEAPKPVASSGVGLKKKQKLTTSGPGKKKTPLVKERTPESDISEDEQDELDGEDEAMSGVEGEVEGEKKFKSKRNTEPDQRMEQFADASHRWNDISRSTCCSARPGQRAQGGQTKRRHHRPQQEDLGETAQEVSRACR